MKKFKVACVQLNSTDNSLQNLTKATALIIKAAKAGAELVCLPENAFLIPSSRKNLQDNAHYYENNPQIVECQKLAKKLGVDILIGSVLVKIKNSKKLRNRSVYIDKTGNILTYYDKMHLFDANLSESERYKESAYYTAGKSLKIANSRFGKIGLAVCYDLRFPYMFRKMAQQGAHIISIPAAFTYTTGKKHWHILQRARAIENSAFIIAPALCGKHNPKRRSYGHSLIISPDGVILAEGSESEEEFIIAEICLEQATHCRESLNNLRKDVL